MASAPVPRLDGAAIQIKDLLFVFAGYGTIDYLHSHVDVYNFTDDTCGGRFDMPNEMAHSHLGMATDERYIYVVTGQYGPQCRGPTARAFVLDIETKQWRDMPPLPVPRYAPATQLWRGRLHVMGGSKENRHIPGLEHWSIVEMEWQSEIPIPVVDITGLWLFLNWKKLYPILNVMSDFFVEMTTVEEKKVGSFLPVFVVGFVRGKSSRNLTTKG